MHNESYDIGMIGLGVMGRNFSLNMADAGYSVMGLDKGADKVSVLEKEGDQKSIQATTSPEKFVSKLRKPRSVMMLVPAGKAVDTVIDELVPFLDEGDLIIDGGNSHFTDTNRRFSELKAKGLQFMGVGISGGEKGARLGPSIMPGGSEEAYHRVQPIFEAASAKVHGEPCVTWLGPGSAGHYVKMVHNGIEYGVMELIAECYHLMKDGLGFSNKRIQQVFAEWNKEELASYLIEITADIFAKSDDESDDMLIDKILDSANQKGTGKWASQEAMELQVPMPVIDIAVAMRDMSAYKEERMYAGQLLDGPKPTFSGDEGEFINALRNGLYFGMIVTYAQGLALLRAASSAHNFDFAISEVAKIWRGGCIIRAQLLDEVQAAFQKHEHLANLMLAPQLSKELMKRQSDLRFVVSQGGNMGIPIPAMMTALTYFDVYRSPWLPANLIQAQRDYFGSHTYERIDQEGTFHTKWEDPEGNS